MAKTLIDLVKGISSEVHRRAVNDEVVAVLENMVLEGVKDSIAESIRGVIFEYRSGGERKAIPAQVREEGDMDANVQPVSREDMDSSTDRSENFGRRKIYDKDNKSEGREEIRLGARAREENTSGDKVNLICELETLQGDSRNENDVVDIPLNVFRGKLVELDDGGDFPRPTPRSEHACDPRARDRHWVDAAILGDHGYGIISNLCKNGQLRLRKIVDLAPQSGVNELFAALQTVATENLPAMAAVRAWVKGWVERLVFPILGDIFRHFVFLPELVAHEIEPLSDARGRNESVGLVSQSVCLCVG